MPIWAFSKRCHFSSVFKCYFLEAYFAFAVWAFLPISGMFFKFIFERFYGKKNCSELMWLFLACLSNFTFWPKVTICQRLLPLDCLHFCEFSKASHFSTNNCFYCNTNVLVWLFLACFSNFSFWPKLLILQSLSPLHFFLIFIVVLIFKY